MTPMTHGELVRFVRNHLWVTARYPPRQPASVHAARERRPGRVRRRVPLHQEARVPPALRAREIYTCYNIGPHRYWTMPLDTVEGAMLINRASNLDVVFCIEKQTVLPFGDRG